ncbi:hypothetical protein MIMGU_mgv1a017342mg [Erythranthe guttata]|uniref:Serine protease inhibitor, potato inhibitor I-type family protein n=1 Tax=Erythranthe guttata TaxID=4155 RepID=A0A022RSR2_ERYGU|nr:hypothetical protein MIMGU_mgv1a017342mg [Erythranthe guttata]
MTYPPCAPCGSRDRSKYKNIWPELVGMGVEEAKRIIVKDNPLVTVVVVIGCGAVVNILCCNRVCLFLDKNYRVYTVPIVG